jgi:hypothetical protein
MEKILFSRDEALAAFVFGEHEFVFSRPWGFGDEITREQMKYYLVAQSTEVGLFFGPGDGYWSLAGLTGFVFGSIGHNELWAVAGLVSNVAKSVACLTDELTAGELDPEVVKRLRVGWMWDCLACIEELDWAKNEPMKFVPKLLTAYQFIFNEWVNLGEERFLFGTEFVAAL